MFKLNLNKIFILFCILFLTFLNSCNQKQEEFGSAESYDTSSKCALDLSSTTQLDLLIIRINWNMYNVYQSLEKTKTAKEHLENSYLELKSRSKNIKNKGDRNQFLSVKLHEYITSAWEGS